MRSSRLLIVLPAATALVFAGAAPAMAGGDKNHDDDLWAEVVSIDDEAEANDDGTEVEVTFTYKCDNDDDDDITTKVALKQDGAWFKYVDENDDEEGDKGYFRLDCDGDEHDATVTLEDHGDDLENGKAWAGVRFEDEDGDVLDEEWEKVTVSGVDDDDDDDDHHKGHHDDDDKHHGDH